MQIGRIRWNRLVLLVSGIVALLGLCCVGLVIMAPNARRIIQAPFWNSDPMFAAQAAHALLDYELPQNYRELKALSIQQDTAVVIIANRERPGDIIFMQNVPGGASTDSRFKTTIEERWSREAGEHSYDTHPAGTLETVIRGQPAKALLLEGTDENGRKIRQAAIVLTGKGSDMLVSIVGGQDTWDQVMVEGFLQSIR